MALCLLLALAGCTPNDDDELLAGGAEAVSSSADPARWQQLDGTDSPESAQWTQPDPGLLRAQDLAAAGLGVWDGQWLTDPEGGISDCMRAAMDADGGYPEVGAWGRLMREGGAQLVTQSTKRHPDEATAAADFEAHVAAVEACPSEEIVDWPGEARVVLSVATRDVVERSADRLLVRTTYACDTCAGRTGYFAVLRVGPWLTVLNLPADPGTADPAGLARELMDAAAARLAAAG